jgi:hypothetical protein
MFSIDPGIQNFPTEYSASVIPQNTPLNTLDTFGRNSRSSFHWNRQQTPTLSTADPLQFTWPDYRKGRHRRWAGALSTEQSPSPDGTTEGLVTWFDHTGKDAGASQGNQILPAVIARVMPDGSPGARGFGEQLGTSDQRRGKWDSGGAPFIARTSLFAPPMKLIWWLQRRRRACVQQCFQRLSSR